MPAWGVGSERIQGVVKEDEGWGKLGGGWLLCSMTRKSLLIW